MAPMAKQARDVGASEIPAFRLQTNSKLSQIRALIQQSPAKIKQRKSLDLLRRIEPYQGITPTPRAFFIFAPLPASKEATGGVGAAGSPGFSVVSLVFISSSSSLFERGEGLAPFSYRGRSGAVSVRPRRPRSLVARKGIPGSMDPRVMSPGTAAEKDRPIDPMSGKNSPASKEPEPVSSPMDKRTGASPSCLRVSHNPCLLTLPFGFAHAMQMRPLSVGRVTTPFIQQRIIIAWFWWICKETS